MARFILIDNGTGHKRNRAYGAWFLAYRSGHTRGCRRQ